MKKENKKWIIIGALILLVVLSQGKKESPVGLDSNCVSNEPLTIEEYLAHYIDWVYLDEFQFSEDRPMFMQGIINTENIYMPKTCKQKIYTTEDEVACGEGGGFIIEFVLGEDGFVYDNPCLAERYNTSYTPLSQTYQDDSIYYISERYIIVYDNVFDCRYDESELLLTTIEARYYDVEDDFYFPYTYALRFPIYNQIEEDIIHNCGDIVEYTLEKTHNTILEVESKHGRSIYVSNDLFYYWCNDGDSINKDSIMFSSPNKKLLDKYFDTFINCQETNVNEETITEDKNYTLYIILGVILLLVLFISKG